MKYIIFFQPRSGSTYIASRLNHPQSGFINNFEIIQRDVARNDGLLTDAEYDDFSPYAKKAVLRRYFEKYKNASVVGCKVAPYQIEGDLPGFFQEAIRLVDKAIFLMRENPVQVALSQLWALARSEQNKEPCLVRGEENSVRILNIDRRVFEYYIISSITERDLVLSLSSIPKQKLTLSYEEYFSHPHESFNEIKEFLEIPSTINLPESNYLKVRDQHPGKYIVNYDEVREWVVQLGFDETLLDEHL